MSKGFALNFILRKSFMPMGEFIVSYKSTRQDNLETFFTLYFFVKIIN